MYIIYLYKRKRVNMFLPSSGYQWLVIILLIFVLILAIYIKRTEICIAAYAGVFGGGYEKRAVRTKNLEKYPRSKFEDRITKIFEKITGKSFPTAYPSWLNYKGKSLELDGYNDELKIAFEAQGPLHTKYFPLQEEFGKYYERVQADKAKIELCEKNGVKLIIIDITIPTHLLEDYIKSRLYDINYLTEKPFNYIPEKIIEPYSNWLLEKELNV